MLILRVKQGILQVEERSAEFFSMLLFKSLTSAHSGIYTCVVTNTAGKANTSAELAIKGDIELFLTDFKKKVEGSQFRTYL